MPMLFIHARNSVFESRDGGADYDGPEAALSVGVQSALAIAVGEIADGSCSAAVEVVIERDDGSQVVRSVVAVSVSPLMVTDGTVVPFPPAR